MSEDQVFKLQLKGPGMSLERDLSEDEAFCVLAAVMGKAPQVDVGEAHEHRSDRPISLREFMSEVAPSTHVERIATIGTYLHDHKGMSSFARSDIEDGYRGAREQMPGNLSRDISKAVATGWLDDAGEKGQFHVTNSGAKAVQSNFQ